MKVRYPKNVPLLPVERPKVLEVYHVAWAYSHGVKGRCVSIDEENKTVQLISPKSKVPFKNPVKWADLRYTRAKQFEIEQESK